jgi:hypothetical protein
MEEMKTNNRSLRDVTLRNHSSSVIVQLINEKVMWNIESDHDFRYVDIIRGYINHIYNELKPIVKEIFERQHSSEKSI